MDIVWRVLLGLAVVTVLIAVERLFERLGRIERRLNRLEFALGLERNPPEDQLIQVTDRRSLRKLFAELRSEADEKT